MHDEGRLRREGRLILRKVKEVGQSHGEVGEVINLAPYDILIYEIFKK